MAERNDSDNFYWYLEGMMKDGQKWIVMLDKFPYRIGRGKDCNLSLTYEKISRHHSEIILEAGCLWIRDLGSKNGTFVNRKRIHDYTFLNSGDIVHFSRIEFRVLSKYVFSSSADKITSFDVLPEDRLPSSTDDYHAKFKQLIINRSIATDFHPIVHFKKNVIEGYEISVRGLMNGMTMNQNDLFKIAASLGVEQKVSQMIREEGVRYGKILPNSPVLFIPIHPSEPLRTNLYRSLLDLRNYAPATQIVLMLHEKVVNDFESMKRVRALLYNLKIGLAFEKLQGDMNVLNKLTKLTPEYLKFDTSLISQIHIYKERVNLIKKLLKAAHDHGIYTIADGISCREEKSVCTEIGFILGKGIHLGEVVTVKHK